MLAEVLRFSVMTFCTRGSSGFERDATRCVGVAARGDEGRGALATGMLKRRDFAEETAGVAPFFATGFPPG